MKATPMNCFVVLVTVGMCGTAWGQQPQDGRALYLDHCTKCHGDDGTRGRFGAKDLSSSRLADSLVVRQIKNGKKVMPAFSKRLSAIEIAEISGYVKQLRR